MISYEEANRRFTYYPETGKLYYRIKTLRKKAGEEAGTLINSGYLVVKVGYRTCGVAHIGWLLTYKRWPHNQIDHINLIKTDNRISNLQCLSPAENSQKQRVHKDSSSGYKWIYWIRDKEKWCVRPHYKHVGFFNTLEEAIIARNEALQKENRDA